MSSAKRTFCVEPIDETVLKILKTKSPAECIAMIGEANETARVLVAAGARHLHPDWTEEQVRAEVAKRMLGFPRARLSE
jgi:hypothetical protein